MTRQLVGLDLIRFSAALMVLALHSFAGTTLTGGTRWGWVGVELFFVLSGFVIAYTAAGSSAGKFARNRIARLAPSIWVCGCATALMWVVVGGKPDLWQRFINTIVLWPAGPWVDPVYWTLPVEIAFYALVFALLAFGAFRRIEMLAAVLALVSTGYLTFGLVALRLHLPALPVPDVIGRITLLDYGSYFALGVVLWLTFFDRPTVSRTFIGVIGLVGGALQIIGAAGGLHLALIPEAIWLLGVAGIAGSAWQAEKIGRLAAPIAGLIRRAGLATYPLYLLHDDIGGAIRSSLGGAFGHPVIWSAATALLMIAAALAYATWVEPPLQRMVRTWLSWLPGVSREAAAPAALAVRDDPA